MEYNSSLLTYVKASLGADAAYGFSISITNPNLHFSPTTPGTDDNVLVQISGGGSKTFSGSGLKIVVLEFELVGNYGDSSPLAFDEGSTKTYLSTASLYDISGSELEFINGRANYILPVELSSFNVYTRQQKIILEWSTESETNNFGFEILRKTNVSEFGRVGFVPGHRTTSQQNRYKYIDENWSDGSFYYRLKQVDTDGHFTLSEIKFITLRTPIKFNLEKNYPNPFNQKTMIHY